MAKRKKEVFNPRETFLDKDRLEFIANCPTGGSGEGSYITGRIQCMAQELLKYMEKYGPLERN